MTRGRKPTTALTPPMMPSVSRDARKMLTLLFSSRTATHSLKESMRVTRPGITRPLSNSYPSAIQGPTHAWEIWNTRNMTAAKMPRPKMG